MIDFLISIKPVLIGGAYAVGIAGGWWLFGKLWPEKPRDE